MILFRDDWLDYPTAIPDYKTTNESFVKYCALLDSMGIKNHLFPLTLLQPELAGIDIYKDDLSLELKAAVSREILYNPWYYFREVSRIKPNAGYNPIQFKANRGNISLFWSYFNHIDYMLIQIRQTGKSVSTDSLTSGLMYFWLRNSRMLLITKDDQLRRENIARLRQMRSYLPKWLVFDDNGDANNQSEITYNTRGNIYRTAVGQNSEDAALNVGRGASVVTLHNDEGPFTSYIDVTLPAALTAANAVRDEAERNGLPYGNIFTTTAGKINSRSGAFMYRMYREAAAWDEAMYDCRDINELKQMVRDNGVGRKIMIMGEFDHRMLGYSDEWLYEKITTSESRGEDADRDYFNRWTSGGISSPLPTDVTESIAKSERAPVYTEITPQRYMVKWYLSKEELAERVRKRPFVLGLDTSDAIGRDAIAGVIIDAYDLSVVGAFSINQTNLLTAADFVADMLVKYPNIVFIPEKKSSAQTFIDAATVKLLGNGMCPLRRIFNRLVDDRVKYQKQLEVIEKIQMPRRTVDDYDMIKSYFGFNTTGATRDTLYSTVLTNAAKRTCSRVYDKMLSSELKSLVVKNGRIDHSNSEHDDLVIAWMLSHWMLMYGKNLDYYGIDTTRIMLRVSDRGDVGSDHDLRLADRRDQIMEKMETLAHELKRTRDVHLVIRLETELRALASKLPALGGEPVSIDAMIQEAKRSRAKQLQDRRQAINERSY